LTVSYRVQVIYSEGDEAIFYFIFAVN